MIIAHIIGALYAGGAEVFVSHLISDKAFHPYNCHIIALSNYTDEVGENLIKMLKDSNVVIHLGPQKKVGLKTIFWLTKSLSKIKADILHLHTPNTEIALFFSNFFTKSKSRVYRTIHNTVLPKSNLYSIAQKFNKPYCTIACGPAVFDGLRSANIHNFICIPNGVEFKKKAPTKEEKDRAKSHIGLSTNKMHFLTVGSQSGTDIGSHQKSHDLLIRSWKNSKIDKNSSVLHIIGNGNLQKTLMEIASNEKSIKFHGIQNNVIDWLNACDVFVLPSRFEGLPIAAIEAVGQGLPAIFSDILPFKYLDPPMVEYVNIGSTVSLSNALKKMRNEIIEIDSSKVEKFRARHSISQCAKSYINEYFPQK
jgi:glycosyltransferase involved in cell wall biosynthesis